MAGEWIDCKLSNACSSIDYGLTASASDLEAGPKFLRITDIVTGHIDWKTVPHVVADEETREKYKLQDGDVVLARTGASTGASAYVKKPPPAVFASYLVRLKAKPEFDPQFLAYYLKSDQFWTFIRGVLGDKSAQPNASASTMTAAPLHTPCEKKEQRAIAHILGTLDDKIELNRRMSETLETMARALFKSWFVDFDPVRAKMEGRWKKGQSLPGLPAHLYDLFPARLVDSELGEIPEGWEVKSIGDVVKVVGGGTPSTKEPAYWNGEFCWTTPKDLSSLNAPVLLNTERNITKEGLEKISSGLLPINTLLLSSRAPVGYLAIAKIPVAINQGYIAMLPKNPLGSLYLLYWCEVHMERIKERAGGTTFQEISKKNFRPIHIILPSKEVIARFNTIVDPVFNKIVTNEKETRTLATLRDTLLPKLISGELRVKDAVTFIGRESDV